MNFGNVASPVVVGKKVGLGNKTLTLKFKRKSPNRIIKKRR